MNSFPSVHRMPSDDASSHRIMLRCVLALLGVITVGSVGFMLIEDWPTWKSVYFTLITITTVGYGDEGLSPYGKAYAAILVIGGIGVATYSLSLLVQTAVNYPFAWRKKMQHSVDQLHDHVIVCGFGRMGIAVCEQLVREEAPFVVVEPNTETCEMAADRGYLVVQGNASEDSVLRQAGIERARATVCAAACDAENVFITLSSRELNKDLYIVSRADGDGATRKLQRAGASLVVSPHQTAGSKVATTIMRPHITDALELGESHTDGFCLREITLAEGSSLLGRSIADYGSEENGIVFVAIVDADGNRNMNPGGRAIFHAGDTVIVVGTGADLERMRTLAGSRSFVGAELVSS